MDPKPCIPTLPLNVRDQVLQGLWFFEFLLDLHVFYHVFRDPLIQALRNVKNRQKMQHPDLRPAQCSQKNNKTLQTNHQLPKQTKTYNHEKNKNRQPIMLKHALYVKR